ncbi:MAG: nodulation protein NfeD, partial [Nitrospinota bacterium]
MKPFKNILPLVAAIFAFAAYSPGHLLTDAAAAEVTVLTYDGVINPIAAEYIGGNIKKINKEKSADLIVVMLDTPGGLDTSMRIIVKDIMASTAPVIVYVAPSGSRSASAGTFIGMSAHISAMAPGTSQGAAHPVNMGGGEMDKTMSKKVENDAAAYIKSLAEKRGRNAEWAEKAVRKSVSIGEKDALKENVIDIVAENLDDLLKQVEGRKVQTVAGEVTIKIAGASRTFIEMTERQKFLNIITNPTVAYMLLMLGFYGIFFEISSPGVLLPGILGSICLILGFYALQSIPVNYAGILLLALSVILFLAELFVPTFGALTLGGVVAMILGGILLVDSPADYMQVKLIVIVPVAATIGFVFFSIIGWAMLLKRRKVPTGADGLIGLEAVAVTALDPFGSIEVEGELWDARIEAGNVEKGGRVEIE